MVMVTERKEKIGRRGGREEGERRERGGRGEEERKETSNHHT